MALGVWGMFFLKLFILLAGVYVIVLLTPKLAAFIDKRRKPDDPDNPSPDNSPEIPEPRPERVEDEKISENPADGDNK